MLRVDSNKPCAIVYSLCRHEYLGFLIEPHIVQLDENQQLLLTHQRLFSTTAIEFSAFLDKTDLALIKLLDECEQEYIIRKHLNKPVRPAIFFKKYFDDPALHARLRARLEKKMNEALQSLREKKLFEMGKDGNPCWRALSLATEAASILFHFRRTELNTRYFPTIKYLGARIEFMFKNAEIISNLPAWLLLDQTLYYFGAKLDGKKLLPFLNKRYIEIPKANEPEYFKKFILPLVEKHAVYAEGFEIINKAFNAVAVIKINLDAYGSDFLALNFRYGDYEFSHSQAASISVHLETKEDNYTFFRVRRIKTWEDEMITHLLDLGLQAADSSFFGLPRKDGAAKENSFKMSSQLSILEWVNGNYKLLGKTGFLIEQTKNGKNYFLGEHSISIDITEDNDWFDINALVYFGTHCLPFTALRHYILNNIKEFVLPGGEIAVIPENWFIDYGNLFGLAEPGEQLRLKKYHIGMVQEFAENSLAKVSFETKLRALSNFIEIEEVSLPLGIQGTLRPYQHAGFNWLAFLRKFHLGGCLADDMGLGKTFQTLTLLQKVKEEELRKSICSLIVMPTSLIHNWVAEAAKFTPDLKLLVYTGTDRCKTTSLFSAYDLVLTTYGIVRLDEEQLADYFFEYIILDESQQIKNPLSKISRAVKSLKSAHKLILSGTPMENSITDLWSQMSFINPGLLGSHGYFTQHFSLPIEKKGDATSLVKLQSLIRPFILRRTKQQVASELPPKTEQIFYSDMSQEQEKVYEQTKTYYRNELMKLIPEGGWRKSKFSVLQGLTKLRQIANHPKMVDAAYSGDSGKFNDALELLGNTISEGHKVLVFSSFTRHLSLFKKHLEDEQISYSYLDGGSRNREEIVNEFRNNEKIQVFLISIKAGGVGLNLIEADYVFILDPWWNPAVERQAVDRTHRIGQTKNIFIYKFITKNSVEEKILALQQRKQGLSDSLIQLEDTFMKELKLEEIMSMLD